MSLKHAERLDGWSVGVGRANPLGATANPMTMLAWAVSQLLSYPLLAWSIFLSVTVIAAYFARGWGIIAAHIAIAFVVVWFDLEWIQAAMIAAPAWQDVPDMDIIFHIGVLLRVLLINTVLLPLAFFMRWLSIRRIKAAAQSVA